MEVKSESKLERQRNMSINKEQPNPVLGLRIPERALNPFSLQLKAGKQGMNKENKGLDSKKKKDVDKEGKMTGYFQVRRC